MRQVTTLFLATLILTAALSPAVAQNEPLGSEEHGMTLVIPEGWEPIPDGDIPASEREGMVFAIRRTEEGATFVVKTTGRDARAGDGKRYALLLKRRGGVALDEAVVIGGAEGWRIVRLTEEQDEPLLRSTIFLPHRGTLYQLTGNKVGAADAQEVSYFRGVEAGLALIPLESSPQLPTQPIALETGVSARLPEGWRKLTRAQTAQMLPESFGEVEAAYLSPREEWLFYVSHVGGTGIVAGLENLQEIATQFVTQLGSIPGAEVLRREDETLAERPAHRLVYVIETSPENRLFESRILTSREGQLLLVGGLALQGLDAESLAVFDPIFETVSIEAEAFAEVEVAEATGPSRARPRESYPRGKGLFPRAFPPDYYQEGP
jgi:hypothetical protein